MFHADDGTMRGTVTRDQIRAARLPWSRYRRHSPRDPGTFGPAVRACDAIYIVERLLAPRAALNRESPIRPCRSEHSRFAKTVAGMRIRLFPRGGGGQCP